MPGCRNALLSLVAFGAGLRDLGRVLAQAMLQSTAGATLDVAGYLPAPAVRGNRGSDLLDGQLLAYGVNSAVAIVEVRARAAPPHPPHRPGPEALPPPLRLPGPTPAAGRRATGRAQGSRGHRGQMVR